MIITSKLLKDTLSKNGIETYSARKTKRMVGGTKYNFHNGGIRPDFCKGTPEYFYQIDLLSTGHLQPDDYELAAMFLNDNGIKASNHIWDGLRVYL